MKITRYYLVCTIFCAFLLAAPSALANGQWQTDKVQVDGLTPISAKISGDMIAFTAAKGDPIDMSAPRVLCLYTIPTGNLSRITESVYPMSLTGAQISGTTLVWFEQPPLVPDSTAGQNRIFLTTISEDTLKVIHTGDDAQWPKVSGTDVIWSGDVNKSDYLQGIYLYKITSGTAAMLPGITVLDPSAPEIDGGLVAYQDGSSNELVLYNITTGDRTIVEREVNTDTSVKNIDSYAFSGKYVLFITRTQYLEKDNRGMTQALFLYTVDDNKTRLISPMTGKFVTSLTKEEESSIFNYPFTDGRRVGWVQVPEIGRSTVMVLDPESEMFSMLPVDSFVAFPSMDKTRLVYTKGGLGTSVSLILANETTGSSPGNQATTPVNVPGFSFLSVIATCVAACVILGTKKR